MRKFDDDENFSGDKNSPILFEFRNFYARFQAKNLWLNFATQVFLAIFCAAIFAVLSPILSEFWMAILLFSFAILAEIFANFLFMKFALKPLKIFAKIADKKLNSDEKNLDLDEPIFAKSGFKKFVKKVDDLLANQENSAENREKIGYEDGAFSELEAVRKLFDELPVGIIGLNREGEILFANSAAPITSDKKIDLDFASQTESLRDFLKFARKNYIREEKTWARVPNFANANPDEKPKIYDVSVSYNRDGPSGIDIQIVAIDQTEFYRKSADEMDFVALAAHELRGPITVVRGYLDLLSDQFEHPTSEQKDILDRLNVSAKRLANYVNNILNVSHFDHKHLQLKPEKIAVKTLIDDVREDTELRARTAGRTLEFSIPHNLASVAADRSSISEVLINLIDNAVKYSRDGGEIEVFAKNDGDFVDISVRDHGIGIPDNVAANLFTEFYRSHRSSGVVSGSGLGLYISRAIVESHGGHISVKSVEGAGATFTFSLPTFASVAEKIANGNAELIRENEPKIENHGFVER